MTTNELPYYTRACPDCGTVYEQRYCHALGSCEPCNAGQAAVRSGRATLTDWLVTQLPAPELPPPPTRKVAKLRQQPDGRIEALSSNGRDVYQVEIGSEPHCTCPAGRNGRRCYHVASAVERFAAFYVAPVEYRRPANVIAFRPRVAA